MLRSLTFLASIFTLLLASASISQAQVVINEFSAANYDQFFNGFGEDDDWIELYNAGNSAVDLGGYYLSDRPDNPTKWAFPTGTILPPGDHLVVWASGRDLVNNGEIHTNFRLTQTRDSELISLANPAGNIIDQHEVDAPNQEGHSRGRFPDGADTWRVFLNPSLGNNNTNPSEEYATKPALQPLAGIYNGSVEVSILPPTEDVEVYYTIDGSTPSNTNGALYVGPFTITSTSVVKAIAYSNENNVPPSLVEYHTYFIDDSFTVPVISVSGNSDILSLIESGQTFLEPRGTLELFLPNGDRVADAAGEYNKHGNDSWNFYQQRGIDFIARDEFGDDYALKHEIFPGKTDRDRFQRLILKAAANDNYPFEDGGAHIRDAFVHTLSQNANMHMDERTYEPCVLFVNGRYWGLYEMREKVDDHDYTDYYYDQGRYDIDFIKTWGNTWEEYGSEDEWYELTAFINGNDMADQANFDYVAERLDLNSFLDYIILHSHNVSADWLNWNTGWWRGRNPEGGALKWRYILWDEDATYGHYTNYTGIPNTGPLANPCDFEQISPFTDFEGHLTIFDRLFQNEQFVQMYINRYADLTNTYLSCEYMLGLLDEMIDRISPEMPRQIERWPLPGASMNEWEQNVQQLRDFMEQRCTVLAESMVDCYEDEGITGPYELEISVNPEGAGRVRANSVEGLNYPWQATYFGGVTIELEAVANTGHEFLFWTVANNTFAPDQYADAIQMSLETNDNIVANFSGFVPCLEPEGVVITPGFTNVNFNWDPIAGNPLAYLVRYRELGANDWESQATQDTFFSVQGLDMCSFYEMEVQSVCDFATSSTTVYYFETECETSASELTPIVDVQVYPNPFVDAFTVDIVLNESGPLQWQLYGAQGQLIRQGYDAHRAGGQHRLQLTELANLSAGVYTLRLEHNGDVLATRVVKIR